MALLAVVGCGGQSSAPPPAAESQTAAESAAPQAAAAQADAADVKLSIVDFAGIEAQVAAHRGKVVVMDAWSTSCPPCIKEFPHLVAMHKKYGPEQLACISLSFDYEGLGKPEEQVGPVLDFLRKQGATFDNLLSNEESDELYKKFRLAAIPAVFVYDRGGVLRKRFDNQHAKTKEEAFTYAQVEQLVEELLKQTPPSAAP